MKRFLTVMAVVLAMMTLLCVATFAATDIAYEGTSGKCNITILKNGTMYITGSGKTADINKGSFKGWEDIADVDIEKVVIGKDVTYIGVGLFANDSDFQEDEMNHLDTVVFEGGRTAPLTIGQKAFAKTGIESITLPETTTVISAEAFYKCGDLETVVLPKSLTSIGMGAFKGCGSLRNINLHEGIKSYGAAAFSDTAISSVTIFPGVTYSYSGSTDTGVFTGCGSLSSVTIQEGVTKIPGALFKNCDNIRGDVYIPATVTEIGRNAFRASHIENIWVAEANHSFYSTGRVLYALDNAGMTAEAIFVSCRNDGTVTIPASIHTWHNLDFAVTAINAEAFNWSNCNLDEVIIKAPIKEIPTGMFRGACVSYVELPDSVTKIGYNAFRSSDITAIELPAAVEYIGSKAFNDCGNLESVLIPEGSKLATIQLEAFSNSPIAVLGVLPVDVATAYGAFAGTDLQFVAYAGNTTEWYDYLFDLFTVDASKDNVGGGSYAKLMNATKANGTVNGYIVSGYDWEGAGVICLGDIDSALLYDAACDDCAGDGKCEICDGKGDCLTCKGSGNCTTCKGSGNCTTCGGDHLVNCSDCNGTKKVTCPDCAGAGELPCTVKNPLSKCAECKEAGVILNHECGKCKATGKVDCTSCLIDVDCATCEAGKVDVDCATCEAGLVDCTDANCTICHGLGKHVCIDCAGVGTVEADCTACGGVGTTKVVSGTEACTACTDGKCTTCGGDGKCTGACNGSGDCYYCGGNGKCPVCLATGIVKVICNHHRPLNNCSCVAEGTNDKIGILDCQLCGGTGKTAYTKIETVAASCANYGYAVYGCDVCDMTIKVPAVTKVGNTEYAIGQKPAHKVEDTAEGTGYIQVYKNNEGGDCWYYFCTVCGQDANGNGKNSYPWMWDEEQDRSLEYWSNCGNHKLVYTPNFDGGCAAGSGTMTGICIYCDMKSKVKDPTTQVHTGEWTVLQAPTCTTEGYQSRVCSACGGFDSAVIPALGHAMSEYVADGNAICVAGYGTKTSSCANCDLEITVTDDTTTADNHVYMNGACYFCGAKQADAPASSAPATDADTTVNSGSDTTAAAGNDDEAVNTGDSLVVAVAAAIMALGTAVIVKKVR